MKTIVDTDLPADYLEVIEAERARVETEAIDARNAAEALRVLTHAGLNAAAKAGEPFAILTVAEWAGVFYGTKSGQAQWSDMPVYLENSEELDRWLAWCLTAYEDASR